MPEELRRPSDSPEATCICAAGHFVYVNPACLELFGVQSPLDLIGKPYLDLVDPNYRDLVGEYLRQAASGTDGALLEHQVQRFDNSTVLVEMVARSISYHREQAVQIICRDITARKFMEEQLHHGERMDAIIAFADIGAHIDEPIKHYSSGMVVRLGFAVATALEPEVLITDEVLAVGDESFQKKCIAWMERYLGNGGTLLLCSHSMYHVQTLCTQAVWIHHGRVHMRGGSFDVTQGYLSYHEAKNAAAPAQERRAEGPYPRILSVWLEDAAGARANVVRHGDTLVLQGVAFDPDDRAPVVLFGVVRIDGTSVYGSHSNERGYEPVRLEPKRFGFAVRFDPVSLLPGKYHLRVHALDAEGLRLFDTIEVEFVVRGETRDYGLVALAHEWQAGRGLPRESAR